MLGAVSARSHQKGTLNQRPFFDLNLWLISAIVPMPLSCVHPRSTLDDCYIESKKEGGTALPITPSPPSLIDRQPLGIRDYPFRCSP